MERRHSHICCVQVPLLSRRFHHFSPPFPPLPPLSSILSLHTRAHSHIAVSTSNHAVTSLQTRLTTPPPPPLLNGIAVMVVVVACHLVVGCRRFCLRAVPSMAWRRRRHSRLLGSLSTNFTRAHEPGDPSSLRWHLFRVAIHATGSYLAVHGTT